VAAFVRLLRHGDILKRALVALLVILAAILAFLLLSQRSKPPEVLFTKVMRERIVSTLNTNGKVEPIQWASARGETAGVVERVMVQRGQKVTKGAALVQLEARQAEADLASAQARISQARAEIDVLKGGGRTADISAIASSLDSARQELAAARRDYESLKRLQERGAATGVEVIAAKDRVDRAQLQIQALEARRKTLVSAPDEAAAQARLHEAEAAANLAREQVGLATVRAPVDGVVYQVGSDPSGLRVGSYLNPGDLVANIGKLDRVRVIVYVDEPDLGRVDVGMPVRITWDALPGRTWSGAVEKTPTQVVALGARQVGEVQCVIDNPDLDLLPGTNINAEIRSKVADNALTIPKEVIRRESGRTGVFALGGESQIFWHDITLGISSVTRVQVTSGLKEGDGVAESSDRPLKNGMKVTPVYP
jgi:HlyD family secretion protein